MTDNSNFRLAGKGTKNLLLFDGSDARGDYTGVMLAEPQPCGFCGRMASVFVSRLGRSRCASCDDKAKEAP